ncbi:hypothetical protein ACI6QG_12250 [Roseococcus sp. DSY-14]|uniref:hypothetical protein n=1 Tax=Roseococcus sp. DSY-14 TaxID=3369650 RepID=UPI00387B764B
MSLLRRRALLALPLAWPATAMAAWADAAAVLVFPGAAPGTVPGQHAEGEGHAAGRPLGRFAIAAPPLALPGTPFAVVLPEAAQLRRLLHAGRCELAAPARAVTLEGQRPLALDGAWLLRLDAGARPAGAAA